eukprot:gene8704-17985_t
MEVVTSLIILAVTPRNSGKRRFMDRIISNSSSSQTDLMKSAQCCPGNSQVEGPSIHIFDSDYPLASIRALEEDDLGKEVYNRILENAHKMNYQYQDRSGCNYGTHSQASHVINVYLSTKIKKESATHKRLQRLCKSVSRNMGNAWNGKPVLSLELVVGSFHALVTVTCRSTWPTPTSPMPPNCKGPKNNRQKCPRCCYWNPVDNITGFCITCQLYMRPSSEQSVQANQLKNESTWKKIGKEMNFTMIAQPQFLRDRRSDLPLLSQDVEADQIKSYLRVEVGSYPTVAVISRLLCKGNRYAEIIFSDENNNDNNDDKNDNNDETIEMNTLYNLLDAGCRLSSKPSSPLQIVFDGLGLGLGQSLIQSSSASSSTSSPLQSPHLATATAVSGGSSATGTTGGGGVWSDECHVLCAFLSGHSMASNAQTLGDSPGKTLCPESSLLTSSSTHAESGGYCDLSTTLVSILEGICREALRLGYRPPGFAMQGNMRNKLKLNRNNDNSNITNAFSQSNTMTYFWNHHRRSLFFDNNNNNSSSNNNNRLQNSHSSQHRMSLSLSLSLSSQRYHDLIQCNSLSAVMTDLENLGFDAPLSTSSTTSNTNSTIISSSTNSIVDVADVDGIKVSLRPYQQQTLNWAIQQERLVGGLRRLISAPIIGSNGRSTGVWFSPLTGEFSSTAPSDVRGGFICEEMGMGKTIITLALILSNPAPVISDNENGNVNVSVADEHWGVTNEISTTSSNMSSTVTNSISQQTSTTTAKQSTTKDVNRNTHSSSNTTTTANTAAGLIRSRATLVVCPVSLVGQWCSEVREKLTQPNFNVVGYHGQNRERDLTVLANCDIVVTTYETLASELRRSENGGKVSSSTSSTSISTMDILSSLSLRRLGGLFNINWHRIVLDESHKIKSRSLMNDAVSLLVSKRRWCVTGTPVNTKLSDFAGQFRFLGIPILNSPKYWNEIISKPSTRYYKDLQMNDIDPDLGFSSLMTLLRRVVMRHSKTMKYKNSGECLVLLPSKYEHICMITLSYEEQQKYIRLENILMKRYKNILRQGSHVLHRSTIQLLSMIKDLQMACSGGQLPTLLSTLLTECNDCNNSAFGECCICLDLMDDPLITLCRHIFCADCIYGAIDPMTTDGRTRCPLCRHNCTISESRGLHTSSTLSLKSSSTSTSTSSSTVMVSKLEWLVKKLKNIHKSDKDAKVLVFSQFNQTIRWLQETLPSQGFRLRSLSGQMSLQQRKKALDDFQRDPPTTVFLLSMRAGAVGVNLTQANHVIVMEPCLNTALEEQAISRVHRIGQVREVHIYRLACCNSVEERILWSQYTDRKKGTGTAAGTSSTSTSNMNPVSFQHAATTTTATSMNVNRMGDPNDNIEAMLLHLRMRGRRLSSGGPSLSSSSPYSSPSFSSHTSPLVGSLTSDRGVVMGKRQYDILFGMKMPTAADLLAVGLQPQPDNTPEDEENDIDNDIDIDMGNSEFDAVLMDEECDSVRNDKDTHSDTATGSTSTSSSVFNTPTQTISGRKRRLNEIMMSPITLTTAMTMTTPTTTMTDNSHQTYSRPRRKSAAEGLKRIQEIAMMERQNAIESESELDIEEKGEV